MAWFAIAERKSMGSEKDPLKNSQITTSTLTILNAFDAKKPITCNFHSQKSPVPAPRHPIQKIPRS
jgi:hypothetical protein